MKLDLFHELNAYKLVEQASKTQGWTLSLCSDVIYLDGNDKPFGRLTFFSASEALNFYYGFTWGRESIKVKKTKKRSK